LETGHDIAEEDQERVTPWEYCIWSADVELAQILVDHMEKHNSFNHVGNTAFETALNYMTAFDYAEHNSWEKTLQICNKLLPFRRMFDPNLEFAKAESPICNYKKTFFLWAAELGRMSQVKFFLDYHCDVNATDVFGGNALHWAVTNNDLDMVKLLIDKGANLNLETPGHIPLITAKRIGNIRIKEYLENELIKQSRQT
jgi:ankyrin repeat protein